MNHRKYRKFARSDAWPFIAMMAASGRGWGSQSWGGWDGRHGGRRSGGRGSGGRGPRGRRMFATGELRLALLALIAEQPRHGYELIKRIEELAGGDYAPSPGAVYPTLAMMVDEGVIEEAPGEGKRKNFAIAKPGEAELEDRADEVAALMERLEARAKDTEDMRSPDLFRAMGNLACVLRNKARSGGMEKQIVEEIVDQIDELARRIEKL